MYSKFVLYFFTLNTSSFNSPIWLMPPILERIVKAFDYIEKSQKIRDEGVPSFLLFFSFNLEGAQ